MTSLASLPRRLLLAFALLAGIPAVVAATFGLAVGAAAPAFTLQDLDGKPVSLAQFKGKTVVLEWINPNCPISRGYAESKLMTATALAHPKAVWLAINSTNRTSSEYVEPAAHKAYNLKNGIGYPVLYDTAGEVGRAYGAKTTPHMFVIDKEGKLAYTGAIDSGPGATRTNHVGAALTALEAGKPPLPATTQAMGCSVKY